MSSWMNRFVAGPDGGPEVTLRLGVTLDRLAREHAPALQAAAAPASGPRDGTQFEWSGPLLAWLEFVDRCVALAASGDDEDLMTLVRWLDEDLDEAIDAADRRPPSPLEDRLLVVGLELDAAAEAVGA